MVPLGVIERAAESEISSLIHHPLLCLYSMIPMGGYTAKLAGGNLDLSLHDGTRHAWRL